MKKILIISAIVVGFTSFLSAQTIDGATLISKGQIGIGPHGLEASYEAPIAEKMTWENSLGIGMGSYVDGDYQYAFYLDKPVPFFKTELKYIYNRNKRAEKRKNVANNSGNYIGLQSKYSFGNNKVYKLNKTLLTEIHWGIQRSIGRKIVFDTHIGLGYLKDFDTKEDGISPTFKLRFALVGD